MLDSWAYENGVVLNFIQPGKADSESVRREFQREDVGRVFERPLVRGSR